MLILLKILSMAIWMGIMLAVIIASKHNITSNYRDVKICIKDEDDVEMIIRKIIRDLKTADRLIIHDLSGNRNKSHQVLIKGLVRKNPSVIYNNLGRNLI
ncbi:MAG: hypothetical protein ACOX6E_08170 [Syntrophomonadaceae bacterium]|jgi:hypothetical protein